MLTGIDPKTLGKDPKTLLQEVLQGRKFELPQYHVVAAHGAAHNQMFEVECSIPALDITVSAPGASRRPAEQSAAPLALAPRPEVRLVGKECVSTCRSRGSPFPTKIKHQHSFKKHEPNES